MSGFKTPGIDFLVYFVENGLMDGMRCNRGLIPAAEIRDTDRVGEVSLTIARRAELIGVGEVGPGAQASTRRSRLPSRL